MTFNHCSRYKNKVLVTWKLSNIAHPNQSRMCSCTRTAVKWDTAIDATDRFTSASAPVYVCIDLILFQCLVTSVASEEDHCQSNSFYQSINLSTLSTIPSWLRHNVAVVVVFRLKMIGCRSTWSWQWTNGRTRCRVWNGCHRIDSDYELLVTSTSLSTWSMMHNTKD